MPLIETQPNLYQKPLSKVSTLELWRMLSGILPDLTSRAWTAANQAVYVPIWTNIDMCGTYIYVPNGSTVSGIGQAGIYAPDQYGQPGQALWRSAQQAQAGVSSTQIYQPFSGNPRTYLLAGLSYLALVFNNTSSTVIAQAVGDATGKHVYLGCVYKQANAFPLPAVATPDATPAALTIPHLILEGYYQ